MPPQSSRHRGPDPRHDEPRAPTVVDLVPLVRDALQRLHEPAALRTHALARLTVPTLPPADGDVGHALRRLVLEALEALRPGEETPRDSDAWRRYLVLTLHYVQRLDVRLVRQRLSVSLSTYYRAERSGLRALASLLGERGEAREGLSPTDDPTTGPRDGLDARGPPGNSPIAPTNLPEPLTSFVGRDRELTELVPLILASRLVTLTGTGGCGKTRLAVETARGMLDRFPDGVWLVDLAATTEASQVATATAMALDVADTGVVPLLLALVVALRDRHTLILLDNCEQVVEACASLVDGVRRACPTVHILATSREALKVPGELVWRVPSLVSPPDEDLPARQLADYDAVRLFVDRAQLWDRSFVPTDDDSRAIGRICRRLDGMPLAIELAAARITVLTPRQIAQRLDDRFHLLTGGSRTVPPRQQTIRATLDWSHNLLPNSERIIFRRLAVFRGGWTLEAAEAICADAALPIAAVLELLSHLVDKSLVVTERREGERRYLMLETIQAYAWSELVESGEVTALRWRHLAWFRALAARAWAELVGPDEMAWLTRLEVVLDNLRAALDWGKGEGNDAGATLELASALTFLWIAKGYVTEGKAQLDAALATGDATHAPEAWARALWSASLLAYYRGEHITARTLGEQALGMRRPLEAARDVIQSLKDLGLVAREQGDLVAARGFLEEAVTLSQETGDEANLAVALDRLGTVAHAAGAWGEAREHYVRSMAIWQRLGDQSNSAWSLFNQGCLAMDEGDVLRARDLLRASLAIRRVDGHRLALVRVFEAFAGLARLEQRPRHVALLAGAASALRDRAGLQYMPSSRARAEKAMAWATERLGADAVAEMREDGRALSLEQTIAAALEDDGPRETS